MVRLSNVTTDVFSASDPDVLEATIDAELEYLEILKRIEEEEEECNNESDEEGDNVMIRDARGCWEQVCCKKMIYNKIVVFILLLEYKGFGNKLRQKGRKTRPP